MSDVLAGLTRASGLVAAVLCVVALTSGSLFSARETGERRRPAWWLDLHQGLGGITLGAVGVHVVASLLRTGTDLRLLDAVVPGVASTDRLALTWGVIAGYLLAVAVFTTWPRRLANRRVWRFVHLGSLGGVLLALLHGYQMGTDAGTAAFRVALVALVAPLTYALVVRAADAAVRARRAT